LLRDLGQAQSTTGFEFVEEPSLFQQRERVVIGGTQQADDPGGFLGGPARQMGLLSWSSFRALRRFWMVIWLVVLAQFVS